MSKEEQVKFITVRYETPLGHFDVDVKPYSRKQFEALGRKHRKTTYVNHQPETVLNLETYFPDLYSRVVKGWTGLTGDIKKLLLRQKINGEDRTVINFNLEDLVAMARSSNEFAEFLDHVATHFDTLYAEQIKTQRELEKIEKDNDNLEQEQNNLEAKN